MNLRRFVLIKTTVEGTVDEVLNPDCRSRWNRTFDNHGRISLDTLANAFHDPSELATIKGSSSAIGLIKTEKDHVGLSNFV